MDEIYDKETFVKKSPIETSKPPPSTAVPVVTTRVPFDMEEPPFKNATATLSSSIQTPIISPTPEVTFSYGVPVVVKRKTNREGKTPFQPVTSTLLPSDNLPAILSSISVPRKPSPETTNYIIPRDHINGIGSINDMCC